MIVKSCFILLLLGFFPQVKAIKCGTPLTTACLGDTDIRYDPEASNNLVDQAVVWEKSEGLFVGQGSFRINALQPITGHVPAAPDPSVPIANLPYYVFINITIEGSRRYSVSYSVALIEFPDRVLRGLEFGTSSYEKDGTVIPFTTTAETNQANETTPAVIPSSLRAYPVDENTVYSSSGFVGDVTGIGSTLNVCLDVNCDRYDVSGNIYRLVDGVVIRSHSSEFSFRRIATAEEWYEGIFSVYNESNIPLDERLDPTVDVCAVGLCPTEEQWCQMDPNCSESPFQEPPASVRGDVIAGFTIAGVVILVVVLYLVHRYLLARQAQRYRTVFAKRIANTIEVRGSMRGLPPEALVEEFNRIDAGVKDGKLSKEEMWEFISSGKAGEIDRKDFDALFAAIDVDGSGNIDFLEFCAFMSKCHDEYRAARVDRGSIVARRVSAVSTAFVKVPEDEADADA